MDTQFGQFGAALRFDRSLPGPSACCKMAVEALYVVPDPIECVDLERADIAALAERVAHSADIVLLLRPDGDDVALISAKELSSITETLYVLRSQKNANRIWDAVADGEAGRPGTLVTLEEIRQMREDLERAVGT